MMTLYNYEKLCNNGPEETAEIIFLHARDILNGIICNASETKLHPYLPAQLLILYSLLK